MDLGTSRRRHDQRHRSRCRCRCFAPSWRLAATIVLVLLVPDAAGAPLARLGDSWPWAGPASPPGMAGSISRLPARQAAAGELPARNSSAGLLVFDSLTAYMRLLLAGFLVLYIVFTKVSGIPDREDGADFYVLVLGATLGMCLMVSANHLLMVFLGVEMASVPSYALAGFLKGRKASFGGGAQIRGVRRRGRRRHALRHQPAGRRAGLLPPADAWRPSLAGSCGRGPAERRVMVLALGGLMVAVGLAFKLSAVPFHFWCPDVFEGAAAEVGAFLSVASKAAALALLVRLVFGLGTLPDGRACRRGRRAAWPTCGTSWSTSSVLHGGGHLHVRQPGRLRPDQHEAAAGLLDDRPCRLPDDGRGRGRRPGRRRRRPAPGTPWRPWPSTWAPTCS